MKIKKGMYVKLHESNSCGCALCILACSDYHKVFDIKGEWVTLEGCGPFSIECDFHLKIESLENK